VKGTGQTPHSRIDQLTSKQFVHLRLLPKRIFYVVVVVAGVVASFSFLGLISPTCLLEAFMCTDPKSAKKIDDLTVFFVLLGSSRVKAVCKMLVKLTPDVVGITKKLLTHSCNSDRVQGS